MKNLKHKAFLLILLFVGANGFAQVTIQYLIVGGGGGAGNGSDRTSGGGSGGQVVASSVSINSGSYSITVGSGGSSASNGASSSISGTGITTITALGGGRGGSNNSAPSCVANAGGRHHGGGSGLSCSGANAGGAGYDNASTNEYYAGGGGGAGGAGQNGTNGSAGGSGVSNSLRANSAVTYGAGGSGGRQISSSSALSGSNGTPNTGNGGNGGRSTFQSGATTNSVTGGAGGSGIVVIRYASPTALATGGTITSYSLSGTTYQVHTFTSGGTFALSLTPATANVSGGGTFCGSTTLTASGGSGGTIYWQTSSTGTNTTYSGSTLAVSSSGTWWARSLSGSTWGSAGTSATVTINAVPSAVTVSGGTSVCGPATVTLTSSGGSGGITYWQGTTSNGTSTATNSTSQNVSSTGTYYFRSVSSNGCWGTQGSATVTISNPSVSGSISGSNSINSGGNATLTLSGHTGSIQWQTSNNDTTFSNASGTSTNASYTTPNLTNTTTNSKATYYRVVVTSGVCASATTASATILVLPSTTPSSTTLSVGGTGGTITIPNNTATVVDAGLTVTSNGNIAGFTVSISENYSSGDVLGYTGTLPSGVTTSGFSTTSRSIVFRGNASAAQWQAFLRTVTLRSTSVTCNPEKRKVTFTVSTNFYNYFNGHYYEYVSSGRIWSDAKAHAESKTFFGRQGYLATINSAEENAYISKLIGQNSWLGATDNYLEINKAVGYSKYSSQLQAEGKYHWVTGPEKGVQISNGSSSIPGRYLRWAGGEPNNFNTGFKDRSLNMYGEHYLHIYSSSSTWNDFPDDRRLGSIIEYGDMPGDNPVTGIDYTRDITITGMTGGSITGGLGTVCSGTNTTTLTLTGASGTVSRWELSDDNFLSNVQTISNTTTTLNATNLTEKTFYRAVMVNGGCILPTPSTHINVLELDGGVISATTNEGCAGSAINLTLGGHKGTVSKWQISTNSNGSSASDIASTSTSLSHTISSAGTYYISAVVGNSSCSNSQNSEWYPVVIASAGAPTAGEVSSAAHCGSANNGTLTLKGSKGGSSYLWQQSTDGGSTWSNAGSTTTRLTYNNISQNTQYRVQVSKGSCGSATSSVGEIIIYGTSISQWTGGGVNANWSTSGNWCGGVIGTTGRRVAISEDASSDPMLDGHLALSELNFNASGRKVILGSFDISIDNILGADSLNYFKTTDTGSLVRSIANLDSFTFAVGLSSYNPVTITNRTGVSDTFSVYVYDEVYEGGFKGNGNALGNKPRIQCTWEIGKTKANGGSGVDFTFEWEVAKRKGGNAGSLVNPTVNHFNRNTNTWEFASNTSKIRGQNYLTLTGYMGTFSPFAIGEDVAVLPLSLGEFKVAQEGNAGVLRWLTLTENNTEKTEILKSSNGTEWEKIGEVEAAGNSYSTREYIYSDHALGSVNYYQLQFIDKDGAKEKSVVRILVKQEPTTAWQVSVYPNPSFGEIYIETAKPCSYEIMNVEGKSIQKGEIRANKKIEGLGRGMYFVKCTAPNSQETWTKFIVQ
jgi:hypothetical protein